MSHRTHFSHFDFHALHWNSAAMAIILTLLFLILLFVFLTITAQPAQGQQVIHNFTGGADGAWPYAGVTMDQAGNLYGTAIAGGAAGLGTVFRMSAVDGPWVLVPIYAFRGGNDGSYPSARVILGADGNLYGTTYGGGSDGCGGNGCGTVFRLRPSATPPPTATRGWPETVLYRFTGGADGATPSFGDLTFDSAGNIYGTTTFGGNDGYGVVFELSPSGGGWTESVLYNFNGDTGGYPYSGVIFDTAGNLYGTTSAGGTYRDGTVYELSPSANGWVETVLYDFPAGIWGGTPLGGLTFTSNGELAGTSAGSANGGYAGTAFLLGHSGSTWSMDYVQGFGSGSYYYGGAGPWASAIAKPGPYGKDNIYGTTYASGDYGYGSVFAMYWECEGCYCTWYLESSNFTADNPYPISSLVSDANGNMYGTTSGYSPNYVSYGSVFETWLGERSRVHPESECTKQ